MANLIEYIQGQIYENSTEDITGSIMQQVLTRMVSDEGVINVHTVSGQSPFAVYSNAQAARGAVPDGFKKLGLVITYKLAGGWFVDEYVGTATSGWSTASNWKCLGPISVSQNAQTGKTTITIGSESFDVATQPVSVSQNTNTGHTNINIGSDDYPIPSLMDLGKIIGVFANGILSITATTAIDTGVTLEDGKKYLIYVKCSAANYATTLSGIYLFDSSNNYRFIRAITKQEFNDGIWVEIIPSDGYDMLFIRTNNADSSTPDSVQYIVYSLEPNISLNDLAGVDYIFNVNKYLNRSEPFEASELGCNTARQSIPVKYRHRYLYITYETTASWITERFVGGDDLDLADNSVWRNSAYWLPIDFNLVNVNERCGKTNTPYPTLLAACTDLHDTFMAYSKNGVTIKFLISTGESTSEYVIYQYNNTTSSDYFKVSYYWKRIDRDLTTEIASESFQYSNLVYSNGLLISATIKWADNVMGTMSITYSDDAISYIDYTHNSDTYRQSFTYTNGVFTSNSIVKL